MTRLDQEGSDPRELLSLLRRRAWILVACLLLIPAGTYLYSQQLPDVYESSVLIRAEPTASDAALLATDFAAPSAQNDAAVARLAQTTSVADEAARRLREPPGSVRLVGTSVDDETGFVTLTASAARPERAAEVANAFADALGVTRERRAERRVSEALAGLQQERARAGDSDRRRELSDQIQRLKTLRTAQAENIQVIEPAALGSHVSPNVKRNTILSAILALLIGCGLMVVAERLDRRVRRPEDLQELAGVPLLATIPRDAFPGGRPNPQLAGAFQTLRDSLTYFNVDRELTTIMVVSPLKGDGKTTVATNLAVAIARSGRRVILVDADLRHPQVAGRMGIDSSTGLSSVLTGTPVSEVLQDVHGVDGLRVLPAGRVPPNPSELIGSKRMSAVLDELSQYADVVVLDTTPVLVVSDAFPLLDKVSGVVALAKLGQTPRDAVRRMLEIVATAGGGGRTLGVVATGGGRAGGYGYGYGYGYGEGYEPAPAEPSAPRSNGKVPMGPETTVEPPVGVHSQPATEDAQHARRAPEPSGDPPAPGGERKQRRRGGLFRGPT